MVTDWVCFAAQRIVGGKKWQLSTGYAKSSSGIKLHFQSFAALTTVHLSDAQPLLIFCSVSILTKTPHEVLLPLLHCFVKWQLWYVGKHDNVVILVQREKNIKMLRGKRGYTYMWEHKVNGSTLYQPWGSCFDGSDEGWSWWRCVYIIANQQTERCNWPYASPAPNTGNLKTPAQILTQHAAEQTRYCRWLHSLLPFNPFYYSLVFS